ncbi:MAG: hypothetical protein JNL05_12025 [Flavobacteriales bacterium]|nr:hypothetical protein [Flavobacteriales bacterium]
MSTGKTIALRRLPNELFHSGTSLSTSTLATKLQELGLRLNSPDAAAWFPDLIRALGGQAGQWMVPELVIDVVGQLVNDHKPSYAVDPNPGIGALLGCVLRTVKGVRVTALSSSTDECILGGALLPEAQWVKGDIGKSLEALPSDPDLILAIPPMGAQIGTIKFQSRSGVHVDLSKNAGYALMTLALDRLHPDGLGVFIVPASFFWAYDSALHQIDKLAWSVEAALALPAGSFAPYTNLSAYIVLIRKQPIERMFVAALSTDAKTNEVILQNLRNKQEGGSLELGRFVSPDAFESITSLRAAEQIKAIQQRYQAPAVPLAKLAAEVVLGRPGEDFSFEDKPNTIYVPLIGNSDVVDSLDDLKLKVQNYAQVVIYSEVSKASFVARYLNTDHGRESRTSVQAGIIPRLNKSSLGRIIVVVPDIKTQDALMDLEGRLAAEQNVVLGLQAELQAIQREVWSDPRTIEQGRVKLATLAERLSPSLKAHTLDSLEAWYETLPFPLASILRAWQAAPRKDHKTQHDHLQHFFEATAEFLSVILLSGFSANPQFFEPHKERLQRGLAGGRLSFDKATFGTWKTVIDTLGKQLRQLLQDDGKKAEQAQADRELCKALFADSTLVLPRVLSKVELAGVISRTNKHRNDWLGHRGVLGNDVAAMRNEVLLTELQLLREAMEDLWGHVQLIQANHCVPRRGVFENELAILKGSNSEFLKETRAMGTWLDVERLYIWSQGDAGALKLIPLMHIGSSPPSARNACYFFNRIEKTGVRFVSYHYAEVPEVTDAFEDAKAAIESLTNT